MMYRSFFIKSILLFTPLVFSLSVIHGSILPKWLFLSLFLLCYFLCGLFDRSANTLNVTLISLFFIVISSVISTMSNEFPFAGIENICIGILFLFLAAAGNFHSDDSKDILFYIWAGSIIPIIIGMINFYFFDILGFNETHKIVSTIGNSSWFSEYLSVIFPISFYLYFSKKINKIVFLIWISGVLNIIFINKSIMAVYLILMSFLLFVYMRKKSTFQQISCFFICSLFLLIICIIFIDTVNNYQGFNYRIDLWKSVVYSKNIFLGYGSGSFSSFYYKNVLNGNLNNVVSKVTNSHNMIIELIIENGVLGVILWMFLIYEFIKKIPENDEQKAIYFVLIYILASAQILFPLNLPVTGSLFFILYGMYLREKSNFILIDTKLKYIFVFMLCFVSFYFILSFKIENSTKNIFENSISLESKNNSFLKFIKKFPYNRECLLTACKLSILNENSADLLEYLKYYSKFGISSEYYYMKGLALLKYNRIEESLDLFENAVIISSQHEILPMYQFLKLCVLTYSYNRARNIIENRITDVQRNVLLNVSYIFTKQTKKMYNRHYEALKLYFEIITRTGSYAESEKIKSELERIDAI